MKDLQKSSNIVPEPLHSRQRPSIKKGEEKISVTKFTLRIPTSNNPNDYKELVAEGDEFTTQMKKEIDKMEIGDQLMIYQITSDRVVGGLSFKIIK